MLVQSIFEFLSRIVVHVVEAHVLWFLNIKSGYCASGIALVIKSGHE